MFVKGSVCGDQSLGRHDWWPARAGILGLGDIIGMLEAKTDTPPRCSSKDKVRMLTIPEVGELRRAPGFYYLRQTDVKPDE